MNYDPRLLNNRLQHYIRTGNLRIAPYELEHLLEVVIEQRINEHSTLYFKGILPNEKEISYAELPSAGTNVTLFFQDDTGDKHVLYQGTVKNLVIKAIGEVFHLEVHALSYSALMDVEQKSRSFQNKGASYTDLVNQVTNGYPESEVIDAVTDEQPTGKFIIQHLETDWAFMKRLASHFHAGLVCDIRFDSPKFFFGIPENNRLELASGDFSVKKDTEGYRQLSENGVPDLSENDFLRYEVETSLFTRIGDAVTFQGKQLYVYKLTSIAEDGLFVNRLTLTTKRGLAQPHIRHNNIVGASFGGYILATQSDVVKVALDIDGHHNPGEPCFFPYATVYSSQDGSGWYCMP